MKSGKCIRFFALLFFAIALLNVVQASSGMFYYNKYMKEILIPILSSAGSALAALMIAIEGVKWLAAQSPQDRENAKKGILYIMVGLILLRISQGLIEYLLG